MTEQLAGQMSIADLGLPFGKTSPVHITATEATTSAACSKNSAKSQTQRFLFLDLRKASGNPLGASWAKGIPLHGEHSMHSIGESPSVAVESTLSQILQVNAPEKYYLSKTACEGILRRAERRGKVLPPMLKEALEEVVNLPSCSRNEQDAPGGGKGILCGVDKSFTLSTMVDQSVVYALQANGIDRADTAGCNGAGWREDQCYTLNTIDRHAVCYDARGNGDGRTAPTITCDHNNRITDYTALCVGNGQMCNITMAPVANTLDCMHDQQAVLTAAAQPPRKYIVRRLTPVECARLQGFPDWWCMGLETPEPTEEDIAWAAEVWERWRSITSPNTKPKSRNQLIKWLQNPYSDAAEYKLWGNGIALPCAVRVMEGIVELIRKEAPNA